MSDFVEYKPMDVEHNVKAAVENLRKAYWSNDTEKVAKIFTEAEDIIVSAICTDTYAVCKTDAEQPKGDSISREALKKKLEEMANNEWNIQVGSSKGLEDAIDVVDSAPTVEMPKHSLLPLAGDCDEAYMRGYKHGKAEGILKAHTRPKGEWIGDCYNPECDQCHTKPLEEFCDSLGLDGGSYVSIPMSFCPNCGADMRKGGAV